MNMLLFSKKQSLGTKVHPSGQGKIKSIKVPFTCDASTDVSKIYSRLSSTVQDKFDTPPVRLDNGWKEQTVRIASFVMESPVSGYIIIDQTEWVWPNDSIKNCA